MSNTAPSRADTVVVFPLGRWCPPQETSQPHPPQLSCWAFRIFYDMTRHISCVPVCFLPRYIMHGNWRLQGTNIRSGFLSSCALLMESGVDINLHAMSPHAIWDAKINKEQLHRLYNRMLHHCISCLFIDLETFYALLALCEGNPAVTGGFPSQRVSGAFFKILNY